MATAASPAPLALFRVPTAVTYGFGAVAGVGAAAAAFGDRVLIVTDEGVQRAGLLNPVRESLGRAGVRHGVFAEVEANPSVETVERGFRALRELDAQAIVAVGGGSPMDTAKAVGVLATNGGHVLAYEAPNPVPALALPMIAVPTTAGTASEVTINAVITDRRRRFKFAIVSPNAAFRAAFVDPELTLSMPTALTAATGMDALTHAIECYVSRHAYPLTDALALEAIRLIGRHLRTAVEQPGDRAARDGMLMGSLMAGVAFSNTRLGNVHAMAHPLGGFFDIPHGVANAILLPHVMAFNLPAAIDRFARIAAALGEPVDGLPGEAAAERAVDAVRRLGADIGIPPGLRAVGADPDAIPALAHDAMLSGNIRVNPRETTLADIVRLYEAAL